MDTITELTNLRTQLIGYIDAAISQMIERMSSPPEWETPSEPQSYESIFPISTSSTLFKGKKPTGIIFPQNRRVDVPTWKRLVEQIIKDCNSDPEKHVLLMNLRGRLSGRERTFLAKNPDNMRTPLKIDENLYFESHYDTESLLRILKEHILDSVGYDYSNIFVSIRND